MIDWPLEILPSNALRLRTCAPDDLGTLLGIGRETCFDVFASMNTPENMRACLDTAFSRGKMPVELRTPGSAFYRAGSCKKHLRPAPPLTRVRARWRARRVSGTA